MCAALNRLFALFQSTLSMRRATPFLLDNRSVYGLFQSTLSMRRATAPHIRFLHLPERISIHALHEESDRHITAAERNVMLISIHALHEESDHVISRPLKPHTNFNPRSP